MNNLRPGWAHLNVASSRSSATNDNLPTLYPNCWTAPKSSYAAHPTSQTRWVHLLGPQTAVYIRHMCPLCHTHCSAVSTKTNNPSDRHYSLTNSGKYTQTHGVGQDIITLQIFSTESLGTGGWKSVASAPQLHLQNSSLGTQCPGSVLKWEEPADFPDTESWLHNVSLKIKGHVMSSRKEISVDHLHGNKSFISLEIRYVK